MKLRNTLLLTLAMTGAGLNAQHVSEDEAREKAMRFLSPMMRARGEAMPDLQLAHRAMTGETTCYYVYNNGGDRGFVIVAGDEVAADILGYGEEGSIDTTSMPDNMRLWLEGYQQQIAYAATHRTSTAGRQDPAGQRRATMRRIDPLMGNIRWNQGRPHNLLIDGQYNKVPVGCVTTATTQMMYHHRWPHADRDLRMDEQVVTLNDGRRIWLPAIDSDYAYDWNALSDYYDPSQVYSMAEYGAAVAANLGYRMSRAIAAEYEIGGTAASVVDAGTAMVTNYDYSKQMRYCRREYYSDNDWEQLIYDELAEGRPVLYDGKDVKSGSGHAFVCDGYDGAGYYSINWGWGGQCNGFFRLTPVDGQAALSPNGNGTGGAGEDAQYSDRQSAIVGVKPNEGEDWAIYMEGQIDEMDPGTMAVGEGLTVRGKFSNCTFGTINPTIGVCLQDKMDATRQYFVGQSQAGLKPRYYFKSCSNIIVTGEVTPNCTYRVRPAYKDEHGKWQVMAAGDEASPQELTVTPGKGLVARYDPEIEDNGRIVGSDFTMRVSVYNPTNSTIAHTVRVYVYHRNDEDHSPCAYWTLQRREYEAKQTYEETLGTSNMTVLREMPLGDDYDLAMYESTEGRWMSNTVGFTLLDPAGIREVTADDGTGASRPSAYRLDGLPARDDARGLMIRDGHVELRR